MVNNVGYLAKNEGIVFSLLYVLLIIGPKFKKGKLLVAGQITY